MRKILIAAFLALSWNAFSQTDTPEVSPAPDPVPVPAAIPAQAAKPSVFDLYPRAIGFTSGDLTGAGFVYRQWMGDWGIQGSGMVIFNPNNTSPVTLSFAPPDYLYHSTGIALLRNIFHIEPTDWFYSQLYLLGHAAYTGRQARLVDWLSSSAIEVLDYEGTIHGGIGLGVEAGIFQHLSWVFEVSERIKIKAPSITKQERPDIGPQFQISGLYRF